MADIEQREVKNDEFTQHAELRIPIEKLGMSFKEVAAAIATIDAVRKLALDHLAIDNDNADATDVSYKLDGETVVVNVIQVNA